jgi:hypothetical protein
MITDIVNQHYRDNPYYQFNHIAKLEYVTHIDYIIAFNRLKIDKIFNIDRTNIINDIKKWNKSLVNDNWCNWYKVKDLNDLVKIENIQLIDEDSYEDFLDSISYSCIFDNQDCDNDNKEIVDKYGKNNAMELYKKNYGKFVINEDELKNYKKLAYSIVRDYISKKYGKYNDFIEDYNGYMDNIISIAKKLDEGYLNIKNKEIEIYIEENGELHKFIKKNKSEISGKYNDFMKTEIANIKKENSSLTHKEAFRQAAANWSDNRYLSSPILRKEYLELILDSKHTEYNHIITNLIKQYVNIENFLFNPLICNDRYKNDTLKLMCCGGSNNQIIDNHKYYEQELIKHISKTLSYFDNLNGILEPKPNDKIFIELLDKNGFIEQHRNFVDEIKHLEYLLSDNY